jgi:hypothetical protein
VRAYRTWVRAAALDAGPAFRRVDRHGRLLGPLSAQAVAIVVKRHMGGRPQPSRPQQRLTATGVRPRTRDDVSITSDGVRLDSKAKVLAFLEQLEAEQVAETGGRERRPAS